MKWATGRNPVPSDTPKYSVELIVALQSFQVNEYSRGYVDCAEEMLQIINDLAPREIAIQLIARFEQIAKRDHIRQGSQQTSEPGKS